MRDITVLFNPTAGRGKAIKHWPEVEKALRRLEVSLHIETTQKKGDAQALARTHTGRGTGMIVAAGGDGTVHEAVNGILEASGDVGRVPLAIIPLGSGDDFVKMLPPETPVGQQAFSWQSAIEKIAEGRTARYDVGKITVLDSVKPAEQGAGCFFINGMNLGFTAHASHNFSTVPKFLTGTAGYLAAVLKTLWHYPSLRLEMSLEDNPAEPVQTSLAALMNGRCFGHTFWVAPQADAQDGFLEIMFTEKIGRLSILRKLPLLLSGSHVHDPLVHWRRAAKVALASAAPLIVEADGETLFNGVGRMEVKILPAALEIVI